MKKDSQKEDAAVSRHKLSRTRLPSPGALAERGLSVHSQASMGTADAADSETMSESVETERWQACIDLLFLVAQNPERYRNAPLINSLKAAANTFVAESKKQARSEVRQRDRDVAALSQMQLNDAARLSSFAGQMRSGVSESPTAPQLLSEQPPGSQFMAEQSALSALSPEHQTTQFDDGYSKLHLRPSEGTASPVEQQSGRPELLGEHYENMRSCYVCKCTFQQRHFFYHSLCNQCGELNYAKRASAADLTGRTVVVTGARLKIGYQTALKLLRCGARVVGTTRFPYDAATRYAAEPDFDQWASRLHLFCADLRSLNTVQTLRAFVSDNFGALDALINNAAQTVARPHEFYRHLIDAELAIDSGRELRELIICRTYGQQRGDTVAEVCPSIASEAVSSRVSELQGALESEVKEGSRLEAQNSLCAGDFPANMLDKDGQQVDMRVTNSWVASLEEVSLPELIETHVVNTFAPFALINAFVPLMRRSAARHRFIINVSAAEGQFDSHFKRHKHPHTNMSKASLNMITRTCAEPLALEGIFLNSVDPGWCSNQFPFEQASSMENAGWSAPLEPADGAARILDPIIEAINGKTPQWGMLFKDFRQVLW